MLVQIFFIYRDLLINTMNFFFLSINLLINYEDVQKADDHESELMWQNRIMG